jgi:drug/metabolite transporter (DMT)-like permease
MLMALPPVLLLPISYFVFMEKIGWQAIAGMILAIMWVAILFLAWVSSKSIRSPPHH